MSDMGRRVVLGAGVVVLLTTTVLAFVFFDKGSHSASDTLRPFLLTMIPLWALAAWAARTLTNAKR
ncbi:MAG: hypothetical protein WCE80_01600 [Acidimicrobiia bacterium]